jgi:hypothetical protein
MQDTTKRAFKFITFLFVMVVIAYAFSPEKQTASYNCVPQASGDELPDVIIIECTRKEKWKQQKTSQTV